MKVGKRGKNSSGEWIEGSEITAANYADRAKAFIALRGEGFVIRALDGPSGSFATRYSATEPQWRAWTSYWDEKGIYQKTHAAQSCGLATVPCEWPEDFDVEARSSDRGARLWRRSPASPEERERVIAGFAKLGAEAAKALAHMDISNLRNSATRPRDMTPQAAAARLSDPEFLARMRSPVTASESLRENLERFKKDDQS